MEESKNRVLEEIQKLTDDAKKLLKYLESRAIAVSVAELVSKCFGYNSSGGSQRKRVNDAQAELQFINVAKRDSQSKPKGALKEKIKDLLLVHEATNDEIEQVYNHILAEML